MNAKKIPTAIDLKTSAKILAIRAAAGNPCTVCPTCGRGQAAPHRRILEGRIYEGCVDACHTGHLIGGSLEWHQQGASIRRAALAGLEWSK
jgi:hypothetical protein